jgi:beta-galactosidase
MGQIQPHAAGWRDWAVWVEVYMALRALGLDVDIVPPDRDLAAYRLVVAPSLTLVDDDVVAALLRAARAGATVVVGPRSGAYRPDAQVHAPAPGPLTELTGTRVLNVDTLRPGTVAGLHAPGTPLEGATYHTWADVLEIPELADVLATYTDAAYAGAAAVTLRRHGAGRALSVGCALGGESWARFLGALAASAKLPVLPLPDGVRLSRHAGRALLQNFTGERVEIDLTPIGGAPVAVPPVDVAWIDLPETA